MDRMVSARRLALGTVQWGVPSYGIANTTGQPREEEVRRLLATARAAQVDTLDTARGYGESEAVIGRLVGEDSYWKIVTKLPPVEASGMEPEAVRARVGREVEESLSALRRTRLDALLLHASTDRQACGGAAWDELRARRDRGEIGALGISARDPDEALAALEDPDVTVMQVAFSLLDQRLARAGFFERAARRGLSVFLRSVYLQGVAHIPPASLPPHFEALRPTLRAIAAEADQLGVTVAEAFLLFVRDTRAEAQIVLGMETDSQGADNLRAWALPPLGTEALARLAACVPDLPATVLNPALWPRA
jgi:aryl-alcohol dehydrogenase-like predicted oxidoreductase